MANGWSLLVGFLFCAAFSVIGWFLAPKGETQTIWRSSLALSAGACYIMWAVTFFAQWHPLIAPRRVELRQDAWRN